MKDIINKLRQIIPPKYKWLAIFVGLIIGISAILELCALGMIMPIILTITDLDALQGEGRIAKIYQFFASPSPTVFITYLSIGLLIAFILKTAFNYFSIWTQSFFTAKVTTVLTENLTKKYVHAPYRFHVNTGTAELTSRMQSIQVLLMDVCQSLLLIFSESMVVLALTLAITIMAPMVALVLLCFGVLSFFLYIPIKRKVEKLGQDKYEWKEKYNKAMFQAFGTIKEVKLFASEKYFTDAITDARWNLCKAEKHAYDISQIPRLLVELFAVTLAMGILLLLINLDTNMPQLITFCAVFIAAMFRIMPSITRIQYNSVYVRGGFFTLRRLHHDLTSIESEPEPKTDTPITFNNTFDCNNITFRYGADLPPVIENFSLTIKPRECIALVGPSGGGKTTLVDLLMGFNVPESGSITADGTDIFDNLRSWRNRIGYVSQNVCLFNDSIRANIAFCHEDHIDNARVEHAMKLAQIYDFVQTLPEKEQTRIGEFGIKLSGGQRQRIAIARALYRDPEFLILDEATSALDNETEKTFIDALHALKGTRTIIMIAHRLSSIENCDRTITIPN